MHVIWMFCTSSPSASTLLSFNLSFPCPLIELAAVLVCIFCLSPSLFVALLLSSHAFQVFWKDIFNPFFFSTLLFVIFSLCNAVQLFENTVFFASSGFWLSSSLHIRKPPQEIIFSTSLSVSVFPLSVCFWMIRFPPIFVWIFFYPLVPTCCSGVYP